MLISIRPYTPEDWDRLCDIHDAARKDELAATVGLAAFLTLKQTATSEGLFDANLVVAEVAGVVEGFTAFSEEELTWLYVSPNFYRKGIGRALVQYVVKNSDNNLCVDVLEGNRAALSLYLSEGFEIVRRIVGHLEGNDAYAATGLVLERKKSSNI